MSGRATTALALVCLIACSGLSSSARRGSPERDRPEGIRVWAPPIVRWEPGRSRDVVFGVENLTTRTLTVPAIDPANVRIDVFAGPESIRMCGVAPREGPAPATLETVSLAPGDRVPVRVVLEEACAGLPPGEYRYEVTYRFGRTGRSDLVTGTLPTHHGQVFVQGGSPESAPRRVQARRPQR